MLELYRNWKEDVDCNPLCGGRVGKVDHDESVCGLAEGTV